MPARLPWLREKAIQSAIIHHWSLLGVPGSLVAAIPNAGAFGQPGLRKGLFDLMVISPKLGQVTGYLELKIEGADLSTAQREFKSILIERGIPYAVTHGRDEPIQVLEEWGAVRAAA